MYAVRSSRMRGMLAQSTMTADEENYGDGREFEALFAHFFRNRDISISPGFHNARDCSCD